MPEYFIILIVILVITFFLERKYHVHLYHNRKERLVIVLLFLIIGVIWDNYAIWRGHWSFPHDKRVLGIYLGFVPLEEYLFMIIVPYSVITIYKVIDGKFLKRKHTAKKRGRNR